MAAWCRGAKDAVTSLLKMKYTLQAKVTELEGHSCRNNIRLYGIRQAAEGTSMSYFVENIIRTELSEEIRPDVDLGIERAHRALWARPPR